MTDTDRDTLYTLLCQTMTTLGQAQAPLFLARFALLAIEQIGEPAAARRLIDAAADQLMPITPTRSSPAASS